MQSCGRAWRAGGGANVAAVCAWCAVRFFCFFLLVPATVAVAVAEGCALGRDPGGLAQDRGRDNALVAACLGMGRGRVEGTRRRREGHGRYSSNSFIWVLEPTG